MPLCRFCWLLLVFAMGSTAKKCANPGWAPNGNLDNNRSSYEVNDKVTFGCVESYTSIDSNFAVCKEDGSWDSTAPPCALNVAYKARTTIQLQKDNTRGIKSLVVPETDLTDDNFDTCWGVDRSNASTVIRIELDQRYDISGVKIRFNDRDVYTNMEIRVTDTENEAANEETCEVIEWDRRVRGMIVNCQKILRGNLIKIYDKLREGTLSICDISAFHQPENRCGTPPQILHGTVSYNAVRAEYECEQGFQPTSGDSLTCVNGKWEGVPPVCEVRNPCPKLHLESGSVEYSTPKVEDYYTHYTTATLTCDEGFTLHGQAIRVCQENGRWSHSHHPARCTPLHPPDRPHLTRQGHKHCPQPGNVSNAILHVTGTAIHSFARYTCSDGETFMIQCLESGLWSEINFQCPQLQVAEFGREIEVLSSGRAVVGGTTWTLIIICLAVGILGIVSGVVFFILVKMTARKTHEEYEALQARNSV